MRDGYRVFHLRSVRLRRQGDVTLVAWTKNMKNRTCPSCRRTKPLADFPGGVGGIPTHPLCRPCVEAGVKRRLASRERTRRQSRKACAQCAQLLPLAMFHFIPASKSHHSYCRPCHSAYMAERYRRVRAAKGG